MQTLLLLLIALFQHFDLLVFNWQTCVLFSNKQIKENDSNLLSHVTFLFNPNISLSCPSTCQLTIIQLHLSAINLIMPTGQKRDMISEFHTQTPKWS